MCIGFLWEKLRNRSFERISYVQKIKIKLFCLDNRVHNIICRLKCRKICLCDHIIKDIKSHSVLFRQQEALHGI